MTESPSSPPLAPPSPRSRARISVGWFLFVLFFLPRLVLPSDGLYDAVLFSSRSGLLARGAARASRALPVLARLVFCVWLHDAAAAAAAAGAPPRASRVVGPRGVPPARCAAAPRGAARGHAAPVRHTRTRCSAPRRGRVAKETVVACNATEGGARARVKQGRDGPAGRSGSGLLRGDQRHTRARETARPTERNTA